MGTRLYRLQTGGSAVAQPRVSGAFAAQHPSHRRPEYHGTFRRDEFGVGARRQLQTEMQPRRLVAALDRAITTDK